MRRIGLVVSVGLVLAIPNFSTAQPETAPTELYVKILDGSANLERLAEAIANEPANAIQQFRKCIDQWCTSGLSPVELQRTEHFAALFAQQRDLHWLQEVVDHTRRMLEHPETGAQARKAWATVVVCWSRFMLNQTKEQAAKERPVLIEALPAIERLAHPWKASIVQLRIGFMSDFLGERERAWQEIQEARASAADLPDPMVLDSAYSNLNWMITAYEWTWRKPEVLGDWIRTTQEIRDKAAEAHAQYEQGDWLSALGNHGQATSHLEKSDKLFRQCQPSARTSQKLYYKLQLRRLRNATATGAINTIPTLLETLREACEELGWDPSDPPAALEITFHTAMMSKATRPDRAAKLFERVWNESRDLKMDRRTLRLVNRAKEEHLICLEGTDPTLYRHAVEAFCKEPPRYLRGNVLTHYLRTQGLPRAARRKSLEQLELKSNLDLYYQAFWLGDTSISDFQIALSEQSIREKVAELSVARNRSRKSLDLVDMIVRANQPGAKKQRRSEFLDTFEILIASQAELWRFSPEDAREEPRLAVLNAIERASHGVLVENLTQAVAGITTARGANDTLPIRDWAPLTTQDVEKKNIVYWVPGVRWLQVFLFRSDGRLFYSRESIGQKAFASRIRGDFSQIVLSEDSSPSSGLITTLEDISRTLLPPPIRNGLPTSGEIILIPTGPLANFPLELLLTRKVGSEAKSWAALPYWQNQYSLRRGPSLTSLAALNSRFQKRSPSTKPIAVFSDPKYSRASGLQRLEKTRTLAQEFTEPVPTHAAFKEDSATRAKLIEVMKNGVRLLVLATHGERDGPRRALHFAESGSAATTLQLEDVRDLRTTIDIAILAACDSASGQASSGDHPDSLALAFLQAGASAVIAGLWELPEANTVELLQRVFRRNPSVSLDSFIEARREMARRYPPRYWAGLVWTGLRVEAP